MASNICNTVATPTTAPTQSASTWTVYKTGTFTGSGTSLKITNYVPERTLIDSRDNSTYKIRKLADGNCWMISNLKIVGPRTLTSADSDISSGTYSLPASSLTFDHSSTFPEKVLVGSTSITGWTPEAGTYYTHAAAIANSPKTVGYNAENSVCPLNWRIPADIDRSATDSQYKKSFAILKSYYGSYSSAKFPIDFAPTGGGHAGGTYTNMSALPSGTYYPYTYWTSWVGTNYGQYNTVHLFSSDGSIAWRTGGCWSGTRACAVKCVNR